MQTWKTSETQRRKDRGWDGAGTTQRLATPKMAAGQQKRSPSPLHAGEPGEKTRLDVAMCH